MAEKIYMNRNGKTENLTPATSAHTRRLSGASTELTSQQRRLLNALVARESIPIDELRDQVESVHELLGLGYALLEIKGYPWGVEFEVRLTQVGKEILEWLTW